MSSQGTLLDRLSRRTALLGLAHTARRAFARVRSAADRVGLQLVYRTYDSPIPRIEDLPSEFFETPDPLRGVDLDLDRQLDFLEADLRGPLEEFNPPATAASAGRGRFYMHNGTYENVDADLLYAMVRHFRPKRIVELGSGFSTLIIRDALDRNAADGQTGTLCTFDPFRSDLLGSEFDVQPVAAQDLPEQTVTQLQRGDILFVDTSHVVKVGGDVNSIILRILPILREGVIVHLHDIFLPYPYSRSHLRDGHYWTEQYLLQAFLSGNPEWEVLVAAHALARGQPQRLAELIAGFGPSIRPGAFWIRRRPVTQSP